MQQLETLRTTRLPWVSLAKQIAPPMLWGALYRWLIVRDIPLAERYSPHYSPWLSEDFKATYEAIRNHTLVPLQSCWTLHQMLAQCLNLPGDVLEAGVFRGGTARLLREGIGSSRTLFLLDSFEGMKKTSQSDRHREGDFSDTSLESVRSFVGDQPFIRYIKGWIPDTFSEIQNNRFCFVHIDLDLYQGIIDCLEFAYPRLSPGGMIVLDDYGYASCPGARQAVEEFFTTKPEKPLALSTAQALIVKL